MYDEIDITALLYYIECMKILRQYNNLPSEIYYLSFSRIITEMGMMFVFPFMSLLLTERLGFSKVETGYFLLIAAVGNIAGSLAGGKWADTYGRKRVFSCLSVLIIISMLIAGFICTRRIVMIPILISYSATSAVMPTIFAMIVDNSSTKNRSESFSLLHLAGNLGCAFGPLLAGLLFYKHMPWVFFCQAILFFIAFAVISLKVTDRYIASAVNAKNNRKSRVLTAEKHTSPKYILIGVLSILALLTGCYIAMNYVFPLQLDSVYGLAKASRLSSSVWAINGIAVLILTPLLTSASKNHSPILNIFFAGILFGVGFGLYAFGIDKAIFLTAPFVWTSGEILLTTYSGVFLASVAPSNYEGRLMSLYEFARGIGKCIAPLFFSYVITYASYRTTWVIVFAICLFCALCLMPLNALNKKYSACNKSNRR